MSSNKIVKATETIVRDILVGFKRCFVIPPFQRNYSWDSEQYNELYEDFINSAKSKKPHYLGNIICYDGENTGSSFIERILIDGQQRITTILLLICAIKDTTTDDEKKNDLFKNYLINEGSSIEEKRVRLKQASGDNEVFESIINNRNLIDDSQKQNRLYICYNDFLRKIRNEKRVTADELLEAITSAEVVDISLVDKNNISAVQTIFEKINSTGSRLTDGDLIRNFLLFSNTSQEQKRLYETYWLNIEKQVEDISRFSKVFYIIDSCDPIDESNIYSTFRDFYQNESRELILKNMVELVPYYNIVLKKSSNNSSINRNIDYLNKLKSDDVIPLVVYLCSVLKESSEKELEKIIDLFVDFMFRYRIVKPYTGGNPLKSLITGLISKLKNKEIQPVYDDLLFELSNSDTNDKRFPLDDEFKNALIFNKSKNYMPQLLLRLEDKETKNIQIDVNSDYTLEHLMPQELSNWWINNLGGKERSEIIHQKYLWSIGNLAILSRGYNSVNSNDPWPNKRKQLEIAQFKETQSVFKYENWNENEIIDRSEKLSETICSHLASPLKRERFLIDKDSLYEDFKPGWYDLYDKFPIDSLKIDMIVFDDKEIVVKKWNKFFNVVCQELFNKYGKKLIDLVNSLPKTKTKNGVQGISNDEQNRTKPIPIKGTNLFSEGCLSQNAAVDYTKRLILALSDSGDDVKIKFSLSL